MLAAVRFVVDPGELKKSQQRATAERGTTDGQKPQKRDSQAVDPNFKPWKSLRVYIFRKPWSKNTVRHSRKQEERA